MGYIHTLYYYQVQKSIEDAKKQKVQERVSEQQVVRKSSKQTERENIAIQEQRMAKYNKKLGNHSIPSLYHKKELERQDANMHVVQNNNLNSSLSGLDEGDLEDAFEDTFGG